MIIFNENKELKYKNLLTRIFRTPGDKYLLCALMYVYIFDLSLLVCSIYHEVGHAMAAASENVRVLGFGVFVLFVIPAAYVELPTDQLRTKSSLQQLRVFSAGVWHNIILVCFRLANRRS